MALSGVGGVAPGDRVVSLSASPRVWCSDSLLGRVLNGFGEPMDDRGPVGLGKPRRVEGRGVAALERAAIREPISTSVRAIDALHTCGLGQRMGIFSGPGVGKSTLLGQIARYTSADVSVVALIGERGREVYDFVHHTIGQGGMGKCVLIVSTSDDPPLLRTRAAKVACAVAEHFRDEGKHVLLLIDSLTRLAQAQRQIGLAAREPPATRGYPPSVFAMIPELLERAGRTPTGSITGFYTVLVEGDDFNEPIPDAVKGITDGHLMLSRPLASKGHFPAIDINLSISRVRGDVVSREQVMMARKVLSLCAVWTEIEDLVNLGAYQRGTSVEYDLAVEARPKIVEFLKQESMTPVSLGESQAQLGQLVGWIETVERNLRAAKKK
jgi:FliI/YscN family ATPase